VETVRPCVLDRLDTRTPHTLTLHVHCLFC